MKRNRNLSGIIDTIQDEGPSPSLTSRLPVQDDDVPAGAHAKDGSRTPAPRHGLIRWLSFFLLLLMIAGGAGVAWKFLLGPSEHDTVNSPSSDVWSSSPGLSEETAVSHPAVTASQAPEAAIVVQEIQTTQAQIIARLDELATAMANERELNIVLWEENDVKTKELQDIQRKNMDALTASLAALQQRLGKTSAAAGASPPAPSPAPLAVATEPAVGDGGWVVNVASSSQEKPTRDMMSKLQQQGIAVELRAVTVKGKILYRLQVPGFATSDAARRYANKLDSEYGLKGAWPSRK